MACIFLSAAHKSSGKTTVSVGLAAALRARGQTVQPFKKGPDYIDPMWLARACGRPCYNLDFNTQGEDEIRNTFARNMPEDGLGLIEGNKGLYDGVDIEGSDCSAALAKLLCSPVILVIDTGGITRGIAPLVTGYRAFDPDVKIAGAILNQVATPRQESKLRRAMELYTDVSVLGALARNEALTVVERHLGLTTPEEVTALDAKIASLQEAVAAGVNMDQLVAAAKTAPKPPRPDNKKTGQINPKDVVIGVARDAAFNFYYADDLEALERAGARLEFFSPIHDAQLPKIDGLLLGGGFPETHMDKLEANSEMRASIRKAIKEGLPVYAECGGLMYLSGSISWKGKKCEMVNAVPGRIEMAGRPQGRGLMVLEETGSSPWPPFRKTSGEGKSFAAHEFHYARLVDLEGETKFAWKVQRGTGIDGAHDGIVTQNVLASFCHQRNTWNNRWAERFVSFVRCLPAWASVLHSGEQC